MATKSSAWHRTARTGRCGSKGRRGQGLFAAIVKSVTVPESNIFLEFEVADVERLDRLEALVSALKRAKDLAYQLDLQGKDYEPYLDDGARASFAKSDEAGSWSFDSAVYMIGQCEYKLLGIRRLSERLARIEVSSGAGPYGGLESLRVLVEAFGNRVTRRAD